MKRNMTLTLLFLFATSLIYIIFACSCEKKTLEGHPLAYYTSSYYDEVKRIPLIFPYEIGEHSTRIEIRTWDDYGKGTRQVDLSTLPPYRITTFYWTNSIVFGELDTGWVYPSGEIHYFIFSLTETNDLRFTEKELFEKKCLELGLDIKKMKPFEKQWKNYWENHTKRKK